MNTIVREVLDVAISQDGVTEMPRGSNRGPKVEAYLRSTGLGPGYPWCAAFVNWCIEQVEKKHSINIAFPKTASCDVILDFARRHDILYSEPVEGDVFLVLASANDATHTGFVDDVVNSRFGTIEGNSNSTGSREGLGVVRIRRPITTRYRFVRWSQLLPDGSTIGSPAPGASAASVFPQWHLFLNGTKIADVPVSNGVSRVKASDWANALGFTLEWDGDNRVVVLDNVPVPSTPLLLDGEAYLSIRALAQFSELNVTADTSSKKITVTKPRP